MERDLREEIKENMLTKIKNANDENLNSRAVAFLDFVNALKVEAYTKIIPKE